MGVVYHGSSKQGTTTLHPRKSTHGTYLYAAPDKALALHFSGRAGDDFTYALGHFGTEKSEPWELVELIPGALEKMYGNSSSIYTLPDDTFQNIHTGFAEVVSTESVDVLEEERYESVYEAILQLEKEGRIRIYRYPDTPPTFPKDGTFLVDKLREYFKKTNKKFGKNDFDALFCLHPELMTEINELVKEQGHHFQYKKEDLIKIYGKRIKQQLASQARDKDDELYIESSYESICNTFPELEVAMDELYGKYRKWSECITQIRKKL